MQQARTISSSSVSSCNEEPRPLSLHRLIHNPYIGLLRPVKRYARNLLATQPTFSERHDEGRLSPKWLAGGEEVLKALLEAGGAVDAPSTAGTPLLWAAGSGNRRAVECLLAAGADPNALTSDDVGAMLMAAASGNTDVVQALAAGGADPNLPAEGGVTALHAAAEAGDLPTIRALVEVRADLGDFSIDRGVRQKHFSILMSSIVRCTHLRHLLDSNVTMVSCLEAILIASSNDARTM